MAFLSGDSVSDTSTPSEVLIVDDSKVIRRAAVKILEKEFEVIEAEDGEDAWEQ
ncbi:MAG: response regulator, partial [Gammaproteobacteria bacterium]